MKKGREIDSIKQQFCIWKLMTDENSSLMFYKTTPTSPGKEICDALVLKNAT